MVAESSATEWGGGRTAAVSGAAPSSSSWAATVDEERLMTQSQEERLEEDVDEGLAEHLHPYRAYYDSSDNYWPPTSKAAPPQPP